MSGVKSQKTHCELTVQRVSITSDALQSGGTVGITLLSSDFGLFANTTVLLQLQSLFAPTSVYNLVVSIALRPGKTLFKT